VAEDPEAQMKGELEAEKKGFLGRVKRMFKRD
jgi:hypothetical protein